MDARPINRLRYAGRCVVGAIVVIALAAAVGCSSSGTGAPGTTTSSTTESLSSPSANLIEEMQSTDGSVVLANRQRFVDEANELCAGLGAELRTLGGGAVDTVIQLPEAVAAIETWMRSFEELEAPPGDDLLMSMMADDAVDYARAAHEVRITADPEAQGLLARDALRMGESARSAFWRYGLFECEAALQLGV